MFNKSCMAISKILRPESIFKTQALYISGVRPDSKRNKRFKRPELEQRVCEAVGLTGLASTEISAAAIPVINPQAPRKYRRHCAADVDESMPDGLEEVGLTMLPYS